MTTDYKSRIYLDLRLVLGYSCTGATPLLLGEGVGRVGGANRLAIRGMLQQIPVAPCIYLLHSAMICCMSKSIRLPDYLAAEIERLAAQEKRSLANMVKVLLEQALRLEKGGMTRIMDGDEPVGVVFPDEPADPITPVLEELARTNKAALSDLHFKPDPK